MQVNRRSGFTLVEMMIILAVMAIVGVATSSLLVSQLRMSNAIANKTELENSVSLVRLGLTVGETCQANFLAVSEKIRTAAVDSKVDLTDPASGISGLTSNKNSVPLLSNLRSNLSLSAPGDTMVVGRTVAPGAKLAAVGGNEAITFLASGGLVNDGTNFHRTGLVQLQFTGDGSIQSINNDPIKKIAVKFTWDGSNSLTSCQADSSAEITTKAEMNLESLCASLGTTVTDDKKGCRQLVVTSDPRSFCQMLGLETNADGNGCNVDPLRGPASSVSQFGNRIFDSTTAYLRFNAPNGKPVVSLSTNGSGQLVLTRNQELAPGNKGWISPPSTPKTLGVTLTEDGSYPLTGSDSFRVYTKTGPIGRASASPLESRSDRAWEEWYQATGIDVKDGIPTIAYDYCTHIPPVCSKQYYESTPRCDAGYTQCSSASSKSGWSSRSASSPH